jgi:hypothetical protein
MGINLLDHVTYGDEQMGFREEIAAKRREIVVDSYPMSRKEQ